MYLNRWRGKIIVRRMLLIVIIGSLLFFGTATLVKYCWYRTSSEVDRLFAAAGTNEVVCYYDEDRLGEKKRCGRILKAEYRINDSIGFFVLYISLDAGIATIVEPWQLDRFSFPEVEKEEN